MGIKQEMTFNYGTTVLEALNQYANKIFGNLASLVFIYNNIIIIYDNNMKVEDFFKKNENNIITVMINPTNMMNPMLMG